MTTYFNIFDNIIKLMKSNLIQKIIQERNLCKEFVNQQYSFTEFPVKDVLPKTKPVFLTGETIHIYSKENSILYLVDSKVIFPSTLESISTRNIPPIPHANQGDLTKVVAENLWIIGNYMFSTWNQVHVAASKKYSGFLSISYNGTNFDRIIPDKEYELRTKMNFEEECTYFSVLHEKQKPLAYMQGVGQTKELPLLR